MSDFKFPTMDDYKAKRQKESDELKAALKPMTDLFRSLGIKMSVEGCGCCGSPWIAFKYKDISIEREKANFDTEDEDE